jgi:hypothetical protein
MRANAHRSPALLESTRYVNSKSGGLRTGHEWTSCDLADTSYTLGAMAPVAQSRPQQGGLTSSAVEVWIEPLAVQKRTLASMNTSHSAQIELSRSYRQSQSQSQNQSQSQRAATSTRSRYKARWAGEVHYYPTSILPRSAYNFRHHRCL